MELCGTSFSKSLVSRLAGNLDAELERWRTCSLGEKAYPYLFVNARNEKARVDKRIVSEGVLIVYGINEDGYREILGVEVADTESEATYHDELFRSLKAWGLRGVQLITSDEHLGLETAISRHLQGTSWQRCQFYYSKNLLKPVGSKKRAQLAQGLREVFACPHPTDGPRGSRRTG